MTKRPVTKRDRQRRSRRLSLLLVMLFFAGLVAVGGVSYRYLADPMRMPVRTIRVENHFRHLDRIELQRVLSAAVDGGFFSVDLEKVRSAALSLPWVAEARVRRVWPDRLQVKIVEQNPLARWNDKALVNAAGEIFRPRKLPRDLPKLRLRGPDDQTRRMIRFYQQIVPRLARRGMGIQELVLDKRGEWRLLLNRGVTLVLGREGVLRRLDRLLAVYPVLRREERSVSRIDLRYEQGFAVAWRAEEKG